jgi:hypothetical protein
MLSLIAGNLGGFLYAVPKAQAAVPKITALSFAGRTGAISNSGNTVDINLSGITTDAQLFANSSITVSADSVLEVTSPQASVSPVTLASGLNNINIQNLFLFPQAITADNLNTTAAFFGGVIPVVGTLTDTATSISTPITINISMVDVNLAPAIDAANVELGKVAAAQTAYTNAGGLNSAAVYTDVTTAESNVDAAVISNVTATIISTTTILTTKLGALATATGVLVDANLAAALAVTDATAAVVKAEGSKTQVDVNAAQTLVSALPTGTNKTSLQSRIAVVQAIIDGATQAAIDAAAAQAAADKAAADAAAENERIENEKDSAAAAAVAKADDSLSKTDINNAKILVAALSEGTEKTALQEKISKIEDERSHKIKAEKRREAERKKKAAKKLAAKKVVEFGVFTAPQHQSAFRTVSAIRKTNPAKFAAMAKAFKQYNTVSGKLKTRPSAAVSMFSSFNGYNMYLKYASRIKK